MRRSTSTSEPLYSPARTMLTYRSEKMRGCFAIASDRPRPSVTSCFKSRLTSAGMPLDSRCVMLFSATVSGMPDFSRLASCVRERRQLLQFRLALLLQLLAKRRRQERKQIHFLTGAFLARRRARPRRFHGNGKKPEALDLRQGRRPVGHFQDALDEFAAAAARLVRKFCHKSYLNKNRRRLKVSKLSGPRNRIVLDARGVFVWIVVL